jgi:hypothetical protein
MKMTLQEEARVALAAKGSAERDLAKAAHCPPWRHAVFGVVMAGVVMTPAVPLPWRFVALALILVGIGLIVASDRRRMGMFVNGYRRGKTRIIALATLAVELGLYWFATYRALTFGDHVTPLVLAALGVGLGWIGSIIWQRVFVAELGA